MDEFRGAPEQYKRLKAALEQLYEADIKSAQLVTLAREEAARLGINVLDCATYTDLNKLRTGEVKKARVFRRLIPVWNVVFSGRYHLPTADPSEPPPPEAALPDGPAPHGFFDACVSFFDVHQHRQTRAKKNLLGRFMFYHFSEVFHKFSASIPRAVLVGQWDIDLVDGAFCIEEKQNYDGGIGKQEMHYVYNGYCLPKGRNICFLMRESHKETPKFYMLESEFDDPVTHETKVLSGHMLKGSHNRKYFHSPVYAVRVPADKDVGRNILRCEDVPAHVMHELDALADRYR
jgi:hypothetical protein